MATCVKKVLQNVKLEKIEKIVNNKNSFKNLEVFYMLRFRKRAQSPPPRNSIIGNILRLPKEQMGFTLAEILLTIGVIGVVVALTIPSLITKINNKGYVEHLIKTYSTLQNATNQMILEDGDVSNWDFTSYERNMEEQKNKDNSKNRQIFEKYINHLNVAKVCYYSVNSTNECVPYKNLVKTLNGEPAFGIGSAGKYNTLWDDDTLILQNGSLITFRFREKYNSVVWGLPSALAFSIDVNGAKPPNIIGRDIFFLYLEKNGKIQPYVRSGVYTNIVDLKNTCEINKSGHSCAYRVITEGKMNY